MNLYPYGREAPTLTRRVPATALALLGAFVLTFAVGACDDDITQPTADLDPARMDLLSGAAATDTIDSVLDDFIVVEVQNRAGEPLAGVTVRLSGVNAAVGRIQREDFENQIAEATDATGRVAARVRLGRTPGPGLVRITVGSVLRDSIEYSVLHGAPARIDLAPADTAVSRGRSFPLRIQVTDRRENVVSAPPEITGRDGRISANPSGEVTGLTWGRTAVHVRAGTLLDSALVSVVPEGTFAAHTDPDGFAADRSIFVSNLDGSGLRSLQTVYPNDWQDLDPHWAADGRSILFHEGVHNPRIYRIDLGGAVSNLPSQVEFGRQANPRATRSGEWIYFEGDRTLWRMDAAGRSTERIGPDVDMYTDFGHPSPSPSGDRVVFVSQGYPHISYMRVLDVATRDVRALDIVGARPQWSPTEDLIAFIEGSYAYGPLRAMRPDGSDQRAISHPLQRYVGNFDWSPDGAWLIAKESESQLVHLIHLESGESIPLPFTRRLRNPTWRP
jgi:hypothetical protein